MKIAIDKGHSRGRDQGAVDIGNENIMNIQTGDRVIDKLKSQGHTVLDVINQIGNDVTVNQSLSQRVAIANDWGADLYVSIHANAGGGHGVEVWIGSEKSRDIATKIVNNISTLGYTNRGVKVQGQDGNGRLYVLSNTNMPALLVEQCFVDSQSDMTGFNSESMANAIVAGITGQVSLTDNKAYRVITGVFNIKQDAVSFADKLKAQGTTAYVVDANILK